MVSACVQLVGSSSSKNHLRGWDDPENLWERWSPASKLGRAMGSQSNANTIQTKMLLKLRDHFIIYEPQIFFLMETDIWKKIRKIIITRFPACLNRSWSVVSSQNWPWTPAHTAGVKAVTKFCETKILHLSHVVNETSPTVMMCLLSDISE